MTPSDAIRAPCPNCSQPIMITVLPTGGIELRRIRTADPPHLTTFSGNTCPECGTMTVVTEGCQLCRDCGWSKCG